MRHRFRFLGREDASGWLVDGAELLHLKNVVRIKVGDEVEVCDGDGRWCVGVVGELGSAGARVNAVETFEDPPSACKATLGVGALKFGDIQELVGPLSELGIDELAVFLQPGVEKKRVDQKQQDKWAAASVAALKQCKSSRLLSISVHKSLDALLESLSDGVAGFYGAPEGAVTAFKLPEGRDIAFIVGGEKGLDKAEVALLEDFGFRAASLSRHILRAKTAVIVAASALSFARLKTN